MSRPQITFLLSVDTEEEWDWNGPFPESNFSIENLQQLPAFQAFCEELSIRPCYFVDYAAATGLKKQTEFMASVVQSRCEIGAHLHPWANPPYFAKPIEENSHVVNLPLSQVEEKLNALLDIFSTELNCKPKAFRTGRWGISEDIMKLLFLRGFDIDSSVYPFYRNEYFDCHGSPLKPYWPDDKNVLKRGGQRNILEMPVTVGYNRTPFERMSKIHDFSELPPMQKLKITGLLWHTRILRKIYFSPEVTDTKDLISLAESAIKEGQNCLHMYLHSSNLIKNGTGFVDSEAPYQLICKRIRALLDYLHLRYDLTFMTPSEYKVFLQNNPSHIAL